MRVFIIGRQQKRWLAVFLALGVLIAFILPWTVSAQERLLPIYNVQMEEKKAAITFDLAWEDTDFEEILSLLEENNIKATFFVTGDWAGRYPEHVRELAAKGHDVQNHSDQHPHVAQLPANTLLKDTERCSDVIEQLTGKRPVFYRAPYGEYNNRVLETLSDYRVIQWNVDSRDWKPDATVDSICKNVLEGLCPGSILLFHVDSKAKNTAAALREIFDTLDGSYQFVLLDELLPDGAYHINKNGTLIPD